MDAMIVILILGVIQIMDAAGPIAQTQWGALEGKTLKLNTGIKVDRWHSVPFAKPPIGNLRWRAPEDPEPWNGTRKANRLPNACPQALGVMLLTHQTWTRYNEDCLYVNIYSPNDRSSGPYPVLLYVHGGAYQSSANIQYPGHFMAAQGVVVVVTNYRLGALGFLSTSDPSYPGNYGLLDQIKALQFIQDNIRAFGGNPDHVTLVGQSAGAGSAGLLTLSPRTEGMFHQVITQSGSEQAIWSINHPDSNPHQYTDQLAAQLNCSREDTSEMIDCLREVKPSDIRKADITCTPGYFCLGFAPVVDGPGGVIPEDPWTMRQKGNFKKIPLMSGTNTDDGSLYTLIFIPESLNGGFNHSLFEYHLREDLLSIFAPQLNGTDEDVMRAVSWFYSPWPYIDDLEANREQFNVLVTDVGFGTTSDMQLMSHSPHADTYAYIFGVMSNNAWMIPKWIGVPHIAELPYVWSYPSLKDNSNIRWDNGMLVDIINWDDEDRQWAEYMTTLWTNFAKYGNPTGEPVNKPGTNETTFWPKFTKANMNHLRLERPVTVQNGYRQLNFALWRDYMFKVAKIPWVKNTGQDSHVKSKPSMQKRLDDFFEKLAEKAWKLTVRR